MKNGLFKKVSFYALLLILWEAAFRLGLWPPETFPGASDVWHTLASGVSNGTLLIALAASMRRILLGYSLAVFCGVGLGFVIGRFKLLDETAGSLLLGLQALPGICWLPLAALWFGLTETAILFVVVIGGLIAIAVATDTGVKNLAPIYLKAAKTMGAAGFKLYWRVILPATLPAIVTGMKLGWSFAWRALMAGELLFASFGLGHQLMIGRERGDLSAVVAVMLIIVVLGIAVDRLLFTPLERYIKARWGLQQAA